MKKIILILGFGILISCKNDINFISNGLKQSLNFSEAEDQNGNLTNFHFEIDTLEKLNSIKFYKGLEFYKLNLSFYDSIYIGKRNDTIFTYDRGLDFVEVFLILNRHNKFNLGRIGDDFSVELLPSNDSTYHFRLSKHSSSNYQDVFHIATEYPKKTISEIKTNSTGKIIEIKINHKKTLEE